MIQPVNIKSILKRWLPCIAGLLLGGCGDTEHRETSYGAFFYDTNTIGTIRLEWDVKDVFNPVSVEYRDFNINRWVDFYNITNSKLTKSIRLEKNAYSVDFTEPKFVAPWLLYHVTKNASETYTVMLNVESNEKWILPKSYYPKGISTKGTYALVDYKILRREDGELFRYGDFKSQPLFLDEDSMMLLSMDNRMLVKTYLNTGESDTLSESIRGEIRMVANNRHALVGVPMLSPVYHDTVTSCGVISRESLLTGNLSASPFNRHICGGEYLPEKNWWVFDGKLTATTEQVIASTSFYTILKP